LVEFVNAIKRPFSDWKKMGIGAAMYLIPIVNWITQFFASGYIINCAKSAMKKDKKLPEWDNWGDMFVKGLLVAVIGMIYFLPTLILGLVTGGSFVLSLIQAGATGTMPNIGAAGAGIAITALLAILTMYVAPVAILLYAEKGNFGAAFAIGEVFKKAFTGAWLVGWLLAMVYGIVVSAVGGLLSMVLAMTIIGPFIIMALMSIIMGITVITILAEAYEEAK